MINPNHEPSEIDFEAECDRLEAIEKRLQMLPVREASNAQMLRMQTLFASHGSSDRPKLDVQNLRAERSASVPSVSDNRVRRGIAWIATCASSAIAVIILLVAASSANKHETKESTVDAGSKTGSDDTLNSSSTIATTTESASHSLYSDSSTRDLGNVSSQIVESEMAFARSVAAIWERRLGLSFSTTDHFRDLRFSECRQCHRRLSSAWHSQPALSPEMSVCGECHQVGG